MPVALSALPSFCGLRRGYGAYGIVRGQRHEQADSFTELQRRTTSPECAARYFDVVGDLDITDLLAKVKGRHWLCMCGMIKLPPSRSAASWLRVFPVPTSLRFRDRIICSWNMNRPRTNSSKRLSCSSANEVTLRPVSSLGTGRARHTAKYDLARLQQARLPEEKSAVLQSEYLPSRKSVPPLFPEIKSAAKYIMSKIPQTDNADEEPD